MSDLVTSIDALHGELASLIVTCRQRVAVLVNSELTLLHWTIGNRLSQEVLGGTRATYGAKIIEQIGIRLCADFGRGFEARNLRRMVKFAQLSPTPQLWLHCRANWAGPM